jgi:hypothetical protein
MQESLYASHTDQTYRPSSTALLVLDNNDRAYYTAIPGANPPDTNYTVGGETVGSGVYASIGQPYNNFRLQKQQPLLQGGFQRLTVSEVNWNYNIPNVNDYTNTFWVELSISAFTKITIPNGYYTGTALATAVQSALNTAYTGFATWVVTYSTTTLGFTITGTVTGGGSGSTRLYPYDPNFAPPTSLGTTLLDIMGFNAKTNYGYLIQAGNTTLSSVGASLLYTKYIDIISNKLTSYQKVTDQSSRRSGGSNVVCRFYITDNVGLPSTFSPSPYIINRQFTNAKSIKWDKNTQIDWLDISLLDDSGRPLYYNDQTLMSGDFQITLLASED